MRFATWNVNSLRARRELVAQWLLAQQPDILCLQETKVKDAEFPEDLFAEVDYHVAHWGVSAWNGVALVTREPVEQVGLGIVDDAEEARCITGIVEGIRVFSVYVPNGRSLDDPHYAYKLEWLELLRQRVAEELQRGPVIIAGDFNIAPTDADVYDPAALEGATHVSEPERMALQRLLDLGLVDCGAIHPSDEPSFTWWDYRQGAFRRGMGMRIDLVLVSESLEQRVRSVAVDRVARAATKPSDHAPLVVEFEDHD